MMSSSIHSNSQLEAGASTIFLSLHAPSKSAAAAYLRCRPLPLLPAAIPRIPIYAHANRTLYNPKTFSKSPKTLSLLQSPKTLSKTLMAFSVSHILFHSPMTFSQTPSTSPQTPTTLSQTLTTFSYAPKTLPCLAETALQGATYIFLT